MPISHAAAHLQVAPTATTATGAMHIEGILDTIVIRFHDPAALASVRVVCPLTGIIVAEVVLTSPMSAVIRPRVPDTDATGAPVGTNSHLAVSGLNLYAFNVSAPDTSAFVTVSAVAVQ
jgi:hypothetical protein